MEVAYVSAGRLTHRFGEFCRSRGIPFQHEDHVRPYDSSTLFCPAGMQQFKPMFKDPEHRGTIANIQGCLRLNDLDELGDGTHLLHFDMMGLFSFREMSVKEAIDFWFNFLTEIGIEPDTVTIHPDRMTDWSPFYNERKVLIKGDPECVWSDGEQGGFCTEFYRNGVEIGNIVNTGGDCIDVGFGLDRLLLFLGDEPPSRLGALTRGIDQIIRSGYAPSNKQQGYVLRRLLRQLVREGGSLDHPFFEQERERQEKLGQTFGRLWPKHRDKPPEWWLGTHGIVLSDFEQGDP